jgi:murein DD-endopeptidase MepM/ murein hydrolase activator NlpD
VVSVADGVVTATGDSTRVCSGVQYGKWVLIKHNNGTSSMYAHLSHIAVSQGQRVSKGTYIAKSGNTGYSTGPHLHVSMYATKAVVVKWIPHAYAGRCHGKLMKLPLSPHSGYLDPFKYIPRK